MLYKRNSGLYWVYYHSRWIPAQFDFGVWWFFGTDIQLTDKDFTAIGPEVKFLNKPCGSPCEGTSFPAAEETGAGFKHPDDTGTVA
jgi:hypothetical protein